MITLDDINIKNIGVVIAIVTSALIPIVRYYIGKRRDRKAQLDISDFVIPEKFDKYIKEFIRTQCVDNPPESEDEPGESYESANRQDLIKFFNNQVFTSNSKTIYLVLGDAGMGKTTFLINLFYNYATSIKRKFKIRYIWLSHEDSESYIEKYKADGSEFADGSNTILLLDALDEDPRAQKDYEARLNQLVRLTKNYRKVIITSRTHFFPNKSQETVTEKIPVDGEPEGYKKSIRKYIAPFSNKEIQDYLKKKYGFKTHILGKTYYRNEKRRDIEGVVKIASNLVVRPMLLDNIELILSAKTSIKKEYQIYEALIAEWILRESKKQPSTTGENFQNEMIDFVKKAALNIYHNFRRGNGLYVQMTLIEQLALDSNISLNKVDMTSRSLLNRIPGGKYKFAHKSILEYILAEIDSESYSESSMINLDSFDFGVKLRNQIILGSMSDRPFKQAFAEKGHSFLPIDHFSSKRMDEVVVVFATNISGIELRKFRIFKNLKLLYYFPGLNSYNISEVTIHQSSAARDGSKGIQTILKVRHTNSQDQVSIKTYSTPDSSDLYFNEKGIELRKFPGEYVWS